MDDSLKIKVLMIYFEHWGKEQAQIYKSLDGLKKFHYKIQNEYSNRYETALEALQNTDMKSTTFWQSVVDCLLSSDMNHWIEYGDYDYISTPLFLKIKFAERIGVVFYDLGHITDAQMKNVDAIVALPPIRM